MNWYGHIRLAKKPPSYCMERISDLCYAMDIARTSPSNARSIVDRVIEQLNSQIDNEYVDDLKVASFAMLDSPQKAINMISVVVAHMQSDKKKHEREKSQPWETTWPT